MSSAIARPSPLALKQHQMQPLESPSQLRQRLPRGEYVHSLVERSRATLRSIVQGDDSRMVVIAGPCSVHDPDAALSYAERLLKLSERVERELFVVMRVYFEKPRTNVGWKGLISDPGLDGSGDVARGLIAARRLLLRIGELGLPTASEVLDPIVPSYLADLLSWAAIGARTTESQTHRQLASALPFVVGFKNGTDGSHNVAVNAMLAARESHTVLGIDDDGRVSSMVTNGNCNGHLVLRGGSNGPNYSAGHVARAAHQLEQAGLPARVMVDCSHGNSQKDPMRQPEVLSNVAQQLQQGSTHLLGVMIESNLVAGRQSLGAASQLRFGQSITDACVDLDTTRAMLEQLAAARATRNRRRSAAAVEHPRQPRLQPLS